MVLICMGLMGTLCISAGATNTSVIVEEYSSVETEASVRASGSFNMSISAYGKRTSDTTFPMEAGETVRIYATYSPDNVSVDFGLIDSDAIFHYINVTNGAIDKTIVIEERGNYTLAIKNNSANTIQVSGFVKY